MNIIDQTSKTNWKYVAITVVLGLVFAIGIFAYQAQLKGLIERNDPILIQPTGISRAQIDDCVQDDECILVDYQDCCVPPQIAINKKYKEEYERHPEWQEPSEERLDFCAVVKCASPGTFDSAKCVKNQCVGIEVEKGNRKILDTSTWQTYRSDEFGFEVRYPDSVEVNEEPAKVVFGIEIPGYQGHPCDERGLPPDPDYSLGIGMTIGILSKSYAEAFRDGDLPAPFSGWEDPSSLAASKGDLSGYGFWLGNHGCGSWIYVFPVSEERTIIVQHGTLPIPGYGWNEENQIFNQILATFRFVEPIGK